MNNRIAGFLLCFFALAAYLAADELPLNHLKFVADGLNIEGGTISHKYLQPGQVWSNVCVILDRPFEDGVEWQELTNANIYPLKEASIHDYNEAQVNFGYATIMHYYITHVRQITDKSADQKATVLIQVHRNTSGPCHLELLEQLLCQCYPDLAKIKLESNPSKSKYELFSYFFPDLNVQADFCYGVHPENLGDLGKYEDKDVVLSFSLVAGLHPEWESGSLLVPQKCIPFYLKTAFLAIDRQYIVNNHLHQILNELIETQDKAVLKTINSQFCSLNPEKRSLEAVLFTLDDFKEATLLQVDGMFNPSQLSPTFTSDGTMD
jgi:hypothetical protein